jgi:hypothetical protein
MPCDCEERLADGVDHNTKTYSRSLIKICLPQTLLFRVLRRGYTFDSSVPHLLLLDRSLQVSWRWVHSLRHGCKHTSELGSCTFHAAFMNSTDRVLFWSRPMVDIIESRLADTPYATINLERGILKTASRKYSPSGRPSLASA